MRLLSLTAIITLLVLPASVLRADEPPASMMLQCVGTDLAAQATRSTTTVTVRPGTDPGVGSAAHRAAVIAATAGTSTSTTPVYTNVRVPARISVVIDGFAIRVRPSENTEPGLGRKKASDGWYALMEPAITDLRILGQASYGSTFGGKYKLAIDRQTGDATFGSFRGVCEKATTGPAERRF